MPGKVEGKVAVVTGGGSGMGRAGSMLFAAEGARVVVADISEDKGTRVSKAITAAGYEAIFMPIDVRHADNVKCVVDQTVSRYGHIDILYHNAVDVRFVNEEDRRLTELSEETWDRMVELVLTGTFHSCKFVGRQMIAQHSGSIILTASADALIGCAGLDAYTAAKGGVVALARSFAAGMGKEGVRVNVICPGFVATEPQLKWLGEPKSQAIMDSLHLLPIARPEQIARFALYLASDESSVVTGGIFPIDSGYTAFKANLDVMGAVSGRP